MRDKAKVDIKLEPGDSNALRIWTSPEKFSASDETAYPWKLCKAIAEAYFDAWLAYGVIGAPQELSEVVNQFELQLAQSYAGKQSRKKIPLRNSKTS